MVCVINKKFKYDIDVIEGDREIFFTKTIKSGQAKTGVALFKQL